MCEPDFAKTKNCNLVPSVSHLRGPGNEVEKIGDNKIFIFFANAKLKFSS